jgi:hypothetical protein
MKLVWSHKLYFFSNNSKSSLWGSAIRYFLYSPDDGEIPKKLKIPLVAVSKRDYISSIFPYEIYKKFEWLIQASINSYSAYSVSVLDLYLVSFSKAYYYPD